MSYSLKENVMKEDHLAGGHRMCAGCGAPIAVRTVLRALEPEDKAVVCSATSCLEVSTFMYPYTAWKDSFIHNAFENAAATLSGVETAYRAMKKRSFTYFFRHLCTASITRFSSGTKAFSKLTAKGTGTLGAATR